MPSPDESSQESPAQFTTTHWSVVLRAGQEDAPAAREALETLCRAYWRPLYIFARRFRQTEQDAEDLTQAFIARFLERGYIRAADPRRGRFRSFLLTSFKHFISTDWTRTHAAKRGGQRVFVPWDELEAAGATALEIAGDSTLEQAYDREWAGRLFAQALERLRQEFEAAGKSQQFTCFKRFLSEPSSAEAYAVVAGELVMNPGAVSVAVHRFRQRYGELVREEVAQTVVRPEDVQDEVRHLMEVMAR